MRLSFGAYIVNKTRQIEKGRDVNTAEKNRIKNKEKKKIKTRKNE